jgi:hypothetical protein
MNAYIVRLENDKGELQAHYIFSSRAKADAFLTTQVAKPNHSYRVVEREAVPEAVAKIQAKGN